jgi:hypothetical protein
MDYEQWSNRWEQYQEEERPVLRRAAEWETEGIWNEAREENRALEVLVSRRNAVFAEEV